MGSVSIGVDFGNQSVKLAKLRKSGQQILIERLVKIPRPSSEVPETISASLRQAGLRVSSSVMGVSGRGAILRYTSVPPVPAFRLKMIMEYEIGELAGRSNEALSSDYKVLNIPRDVSQDFTVMVAMSKDESVRDSMLQLSAAGISTTCILPTPLAIYNTFLGIGDFEEGKNYLVVDIGATNVDIVIIGEKDLYFARSIGRGADDFTEALSETLAVGFPEAERIKLAEGLIARSGWRSEHEKKISDALIGAADRLYATLNSSVGFARRQLKLKDLKIDKVILLGGGSNLPGLSDYLSLSFNTEVSTPNLLLRQEEAADLSPGIRVSGTLPPEDISMASPELREFSTAIGLAISKMGSPFYQMDLIPAEEKKKRTFKERTIFLYIAGVILLVFVIGRIFTAGSELSEASERQTGLEERVEEANQRLFSMRKVNKENTEIETAIEHLGKKTLPGTFMTQLIFLTRKREVTPDEIKIGEMTLKAPSFEDEAKEQVISAVIRGVVKSSTGNEYEIVRKFRDQMLKTELIKSARIDPSRTTLVKGEFRFEIEVSPGRVK